MKNIGNMSATFIEKIITNVKQTNFSVCKGKNIFLQGDQVENLFFILSGRIKLIRDTIEGGQLVVYIALPSETFAEASLFSSVYHCSAIAESESILLGYNKSELLQHLEKHPASMRSLLELFSQQVRDLRTINEIKNIHSAKERIMAYLRNEMNGNNEVNLPVSLKDIAYKIGLAHETFYRELKKLEQAGVLLRKDRHIKLFLF